MFAGCDRINNLNLNSFDVTCLHNLFRECTHLTSLNTPNRLMSDTCETCDVFDGCTGINNVNFLTKYISNHVTDDD